MAVAGLRSGLLEISTIFVPFRKSRFSKLKSLLHSIPRAPLLPHFLFLYQGGMFSVPRLQIAEGGTERTWAVFLFPSASSVPKEEAQLQGTDRHTGVFDPPPPFFLQDPPGWIHFLLWEIKWHSHGGRGVLTAFISTRKWSVFGLQLGINYIESLSKLSTEFF